MWELLEGACTGLDLLLAEHTLEGGVSNTYEKFVSGLRKRDQLTVSLVTEEQRATTMEQLATFFSLHIPNETHRRQLELLRQEASKVRLGACALVCNATTVNFTPQNDIS